jgi:hypothetical protein
MASARKRNRLSRACCTLAMNDFLSVRAKNVATLATCSLLICGPILAANADENYFGYSYGAEVLPRGKVEAYSWTTGRFGKGKGVYSAYDFKQELEYGVTDRFQIGVYVNEVYHRFSGGPLADSGKDVAKHRNRFSYQGNEVEFKYMVLNPLKDPVGLALLVEPEYKLANSVSGDKDLELELAGKVILQKNFLDDQLITVLNVATEFEWERPRPSRGESFKNNMLWEVSDGVSYRIASGWFIGVEGLYHTEFEGVNIHNQGHWAIFVGPTLHYATQRWWATLTWLPQVIGGPTDDSRSSQLHLGEQARNEVRLKIGFDF